MNHQSTKYTAEESDVIHALEVVYAGRSEYFWEYVDECHKTVDLFIKERVDGVKIIEDEIDFMVQPGYTRKMRVNRCPNCKNDKLTLLHSYCFLCGVKLNWR